ncbi:hypothetical protein RF11_01960 [Thelohanellus kitauei]|uniref:Anaphase-promoting complex subunit 5 n=1 Tax=Thelohanellus kitauei TaxID=669202 RepID=A0A0C2IR95_THEKT|nr:hypothetical protein RF11_01960 [Thelohanellus kitauei]
MTNLVNPADLESFQNIMRDGSSLVLIFIMEHFDPDSSLRIHDSQMYKSLESFEIEIYNHFYYWIQKEVSLQNLTIELIEIFQDPTILIQVYEQCCKISSLQSFSEFRQFIFDLNIYRKRMPSIFGLYKLKFYKKFLGLQIDEKISLLEFFNANLVNIIGLLKNGVKIEPLIDMIANPVKREIDHLNINKLSDNLESLVPFDPSKPNVVLRLAQLMSMKESEIFQRYGLYNESASKIITFLYNSFKSKNPRMISLSLALAICSLSKIKPHDENLGRLIEDLINKSRDFKERDFLIYGQRINLYKFKLTDIKTALKYLCECQTTNLEEFVYTCLIRAHLWSNNGYVSISDEILKHILDILHTLNNSDELYESYICIKSYNLYRKNNFAESLDLLRHHLETSFSQKALRCYEKLNLMINYLQVEIPAKKEVIDYFESNAHAYYSHFCTLISSCDYLTAIDELNGYLKKLDSETQDYDELIEYLIYKQMLCECYFKTEQFYLALKNSTQLVKFCLKKSLNSYCATSLLMVAKSLTQLYLPHRAIPVITLIKSRFWSFLSRLEKIELVELLLYGEISFSKTVWDDSKKIVEWCRAFYRKHKLKHNFEERIKLFGDILSSSDDS